jgi:hypothetical protein
VVEFTRWSDSRDVSGVEPDLVTDPEQWLVCKV